ncbi:hypothetical protein Tco_1505103 [Tanacetum coccineum]
MKKYCSQSRLRRASHIKATTRDPIPVTADDDIHSQRNDDHQEDDAPPEGEIIMKRHKASKSLKSSMGSSSKHSAKDSTTYATLNDMLSNQFKNAEENLNEPPRYLFNKDLFFLKNRNIKEKKYILSLHKIHAERFPKDDLEEKMNRWSIGTHDDEACSSSSRPKRVRITKNLEEALMGHVLHEFLLWGNCNMTLKNRYSTNLAGNLSKQIYSPFIVDWNVLNTLGCDNAIGDMLEVRVNEMGSDAVLFTSEAWKHAFDINEPIYTELCHEFYATFEFDEAVADDELMMKKAIKFRLCGKAYAISVLDFGKRLGLYTGAEIQEYGFETYFIGGLRNDDDFSADQYWLNISSEETLTLSRSSAKTIRKPVLKVFAENDYIWFMSKNYRLGILSDEVLNGLSAPTYYKILDANILRELIGSNGRLIPEEIAPSISRVVTPRAQRPTTSDLYNKISQLETQIVTLRDPYDPPSYFEQQQQDDEE